MRKLSLSNTSVRATKASAIDMLNLSDTMQAMTRGGAALDAWELVLSVGNSATCSSLCFCQLNIAFIQF